MLLLLDFIIMLIFLKAGLLIRQNSCIMEKIFHMEVSLILIE